MLWTDQRADVCRGVASGTEPQLFCFFNAKPDELFRDPLLDEQPFDGKAHLATIRIAAPDGRAGYHVKVSIRENDHGVFAAKFENRWNQFFRTGFGHPPARGHASGKHHFVRRGINQSLAHFTASLNYSDDILGKSGIDEKSLDERATLRREVAVLAQNRIARRYCRYDLTHRNRQRIIPRANDPQHTPWLVAQRPGFGSCRSTVMRDRRRPQQFAALLCEVLRRIQ